MTNECQHPQVYDNGDWQACSACGSIRPMFVNNEETEWLSKNQILTLKARADAAEAKAKLLAEAAREWLRAKEYREHLPVPFGATPLTHPEIFNNALGSAKEANRLLTEALARYDAAEEGKA